MCLIMTEQGLRAIGGEMHCNDGLGKRPNTGFVPYWCLATNGNEAPQAIGPIVQSLCYPVQPGAQFAFRMTEAEAMTSGLV